MFLLVPTAAVMPTSILTVAVLVVILRRSIPALHIRLSLFVATTPTLILAIVPPVFLTVIPFLVRVVSLGVPVVDQILRLMTSLLAPL